MVAIGIIASLTSVVLAVVARVPTYRVAPLFLIPLLWAPYVLRRWLNLHWFHYLLFASAVMLHNFGALGWYQRGPFPTSFDIVVHFYFGFVATFLFFRAIEQHVPLGTWPLRLFALMFVMGSGGIHEVVEYASYLLLGEEKGMVKPTTSYFLDTQRDLLNNLCGCVLALTLYGVYRRLADQQARGRGVAVISQNAAADRAHG